MANQTKKRHPFRNLVVSIGVAACMVTAYGSAQNSSDVIVLTAVILICVAVVLHSVAQFRVRVQRKRTRPVRERSQHIMTARESRKWSL